MYGSIGSGGSGGNDGAGGRRALKEQVQQQVAATTTPLQNPVSQRPSSTASPRPFPGLADRLLEGYISVLDHKVSAEKRCRGGRRQGGLIDV